MKDFLEKHPKAAQWIREGGLFVLFSYVVTFIKYLLLTFLPGFFHGIVGDVEWVWPGIRTTMFGVPFTLAVIGNSLADGGLAFTLANYTSIILGECINFPLQRNITFKSKGNVWYQAMWYFIAWLVITPIVNSLNCIWVGVMKDIVPGWLYNIGSTFLMGGISMIVFFFVFKIIFPEGEKKEEK